MEISLALHIVGIVFWIGGLLFLTKTLKFDLSRNPDLAVLNRKLLFGWLLPGIIITLVTGIYQFLQVGAAVLMKQGWFHGKLTLVVLLLLASGYVFAKAQSGKVKFLTAIHAFAASALVLISVFTLLKF